MQITLNAVLLAKEVETYDFESCGMKNETTFSLWNVDISTTSHDYVKVSDHQFTLEVPDDFDPRAGYVANLEREKERLSAEFQARVTEINAQIQSLLAIEA